jgi:HEAT repeat protein
LRALAALGRAFPAHARGIEAELTATLREPGFFAVLSAAAALGQLGRPQAVAALRRLEESDVDGRLQRAARDAIAALTQNATPEAWKSIRDELDTLRSDNRMLRERLQKVEAHIAARRGPRPNQRAG